MFTTYVLVKGADAEVFAIDIENPLYGLLPLNLLETSKAREVMFDGPKIPAAFNSAGVNNI